jgi:hypothetical protein
MTSSRRNSKAGRNVSCFSKWLSVEPGLPRTNRRRARPAARHSLFQALEQRIVLDSMAWIGGTGNWDDSSQWQDNTSPGNHALPVSGDMVTIDTGETAAAITIRSGDNITVQSLTTGVNDTLSITGGSLTVTSGTSSLDGPLDMTGGYLEASDDPTTQTTASLTANAATTVSQASLYAENGGTLSFPDLTSSVANGTFEANGTGSALDVSAMTTLTQAGGCTVNALNGGSVDLSGLTSLTSTQGIYITDTGGSTLADASLTTLSGVTVTLDGTDRHVADSWSSFTNGSLTVNGDPSHLGYSLSALTDVDGSSLSADNGGQLALPKLTSYASNGGFVASGTGSLLDVSALNTFTQAGPWDISALGGATLKLSGLASLTGTVAINIDDIGGSTLEDSKLTTLAGVNVSLDGTDQHVANSWTSFTNGNLTVNGNALGSGYSLTALIDVDGSNLTVEGGGQLALPNLTSYAANGTTFESEGTNPAMITPTPSVLDLSALATLTQTGNFVLDAYYGATLKLSGLTSINSAIGILINDIGGSTIEDADLTTLTGVNYSTDGTDAQGPSAWTTFSGGTVGVSNGGTLTLPALTAFLNSNLILRPGAALNLPVITQGNLEIANGTSVTVPGGTVALPTDGTSGATITVPSSPSLTFSLDNAGTLTGTTFNVGAGSTLALVGGTYLGNTTFNVSDGATADLTGGVQTTNYGGTLTGSDTGSGTGAATVALAGGAFAPVVGGVTLNFPGNLFQWSDGVIAAALGDVINQGTMNLVGADDKVLKDDGTLDDQGTIVQTGSGNLGLHSDSAAPTTLKIEAGGTYQIESDSGIDNAFGGSTAVVNAGTIIKTGGTGTSTLTIAGPLANTGTIQAESGTLDLEPTSFAQLALGTLSGGTWNAMRGATLQFPMNTSIASNEANVTLDGSGATIAALALNSNSGALAVTNGAGLALRAGFSNSGTLTVGGTLNVGGNFPLASTGGIHPLVILTAAFSNSGALTVGGTLNVDGDFKQTSTGSFIEQIGGNSVGGPFGQTMVTGAATLGGAFNLSLTNSFTPGQDQEYPVLEYASASGQFAAVNGLPSGMTANQGATEFDLDVPAVTADLAVTSVTAPATAANGQSITVNWQVTDQDAIAATGSWQDSVYLSTTPTISPTSILLGSTIHTGGLAANASYDGSLTAAVPATFPGQYHVLIVADSLYQVPDVDRSNNTLADANPLQLSLPSLTFGTPYSDSFTANDQGRYYAITVPAGTPLYIAVTGSPASENNAIYVSLANLPTPYQAEFQTSSSAGADPTLAVPTTIGGTYYVLVENVSGTPGAFSITASQPGLMLTTASPATVGNAGQATLTVTGLDLQSSTTYTLIGPGGSIPAAATSDDNSNLAYVTFNLTGVTPGSYDLQAANADGTTKLTGAVQVTAGGGANVVATPLADGLVRAGRTSVLTVQYANLGDDDAPAPLLSITSPLDIPMTLDSGETPQALSLQALALNQNGPPNVLPPGAKGQFSVYFLPSAAGSYDFNVSVSDTTDTEAFTGDDWQNVLSSVPSDITSVANWPAIYAALQQEIGSTWGSYVSLLDHDATLLPPTLGNASHPADVLQLAIQQAEASVTASISGMATASGAGVVLAGNVITATNSTTGDAFTATILDDGSFVFPSVTPGSYTFSVPEDVIDGSPAPVQVSAGQAITGVTLTLDPEAILAGQVTAAATGAPAAGATVIVTSNGGVVNQISTDASGNYALAVPPGSYSLVVAGQNLARSDFTTTLAAGVSTQNFSLEPEATVSGTVSLSDGQPVTSVVVLAVLQGNEAMPDFAQPFTSANFTLGSLPAGVYDISVTVPGYTPVTLNNVSVGEAQSVQLGTFQLSPIDDRASVAVGDLYAADEALVYGMFASKGAGASAMQVLQEYFSGPGVATINSIIPPIITYTPQPKFPDGPTNPPVTLYGKDLFSLANSATTDNALQQTLSEIADRLYGPLGSNDLQMKAARAKLANESCNAPAIELQWPVSDLMPELGLGNWMNVTLNPMLDPANGFYGTSPDNVLRMWNYTDGSIGAKIIGGVGLGGPPPLNAATAYDDRQLSGTVYLTIQSNGQAQLSVQFTVTIQDTFDFDPGGKGQLFDDGTVEGGLNLYQYSIKAQGPVLGLVQELVAQPVDTLVAAGAYSLGALETLDFTCDVPVVAQFSPSSAFLQHMSFNTSMPNCGAPQGNGNGGQTSGTVVNSNDPNALLGPAGYGTKGFVQDSGTWPYTVDFENDGTAAAQTATVTEQLDSNLDWSTFQLGSFGWGNVHVTVPAGLTSYQTTVGYQNSDGTALDVLVTLDFNAGTGLLTVTFVSLDPSTGKPPTGALDGFLYPEDGTGVGQGYVEYSIQPKQGLATGTTITQQASVVFDTNAPLATDPAVNTIDSGAPTSSVAALPAVETSASFTVNWSGSDDAGGSGIATYEVFVSDNGGPFMAFQTATSNTSATFTGVQGQTYAFYSVATDNVGNVQPTPTKAQSTTTVDSLLPTSSVAALPASETSTSFTVSWSGSDAGGPGIADYNVYVSDNGGPFTAFQTNTTQTSATFTGVDGHTYGFYSVATDTLGNAQTTPTTAQATTTVDTVFPTSSVAALPAAETSTSFTVSWSGSDTGGPGIAGYNVYVSDNGGPFTAFQTDTTQTSAVFSGVNGHIYGFYSVATDTLGNAQTTPAGAQAVTTISPTTVLSTSSVNALPPLSEASFKVSWSGSDAGGPGIASYDIYVSVDSGPFTAWLTGTTATSATYPGALDHTYAFYSVATDNDGHRQPTPNMAQATTQTLIVDANGLYVAALFQQLLGRAADANGLAFWTHLLDSGTTDAAVASALVHSAEYYTNLIEADYSQLLGRPADPMGLAAWLDLMQHHGWTDQQLQASIASSAEFFHDAGGTNADWIGAVYKLLLGRPPEQRAVGFWEGQLAGGQTLYQVALRIANSAENNTNLINDDYTHYLGRSADPNGLDFWLSQFAAGATDEDVIAGFTGSAEYYDEHS